MSVRKILIRSLAAVFALLLVALIFINGLIDALTRPLIADKNSPAPDYILVLGAGLNDDGSPGRMLRDRLNTATVDFGKIASIVNGKSNISGTVRRKDGRTENDARTVVNHDQLQHQGGAAHCPDHGARKRR